MSALSRFSHGLEYSVNNGKATVCGIGSFNEKDLVIPPVTPEGFEIIAIADKAFFRNSTIESISVPESLKAVGKAAFAWCSSLKAVKLGLLISIGDRAFMGCDRLSNVDFGSKLCSIGEKAFAYCPSLISVALPATVQRLGISAFEGCRALRRVILPLSLKMLENGVFYACGSLCRVDMPQKLEYIDEYAFAYCTSISELDLPAHTVINGLAFYECGNNRSIKVS